MKRSQTRAIADRLAVTAKVIPVYTPPKLVRMQVTVYNLQYRRVKNLGRLPPSSVWSTRKTFNDADTAERARLHCLVQPGAHVFEFRVWREVQTIVRRMHEPAIYRQIELQACN